MKNLKFDANGEHHTKIKTLNMDAVYEGYKIWMYKVENENNEVYYEALSNYGGVSSGNYYKSLKEMDDFYNLWLSDLA